MAWINTPSCYVWDVDYDHRKQAADRALELAEQYTIFTETRPTEEGKYEVITRNTITEEHSAACRCEQCVPF